MLKLLDRVKEEYTNIIRVLFEGINILRVVVFSFVASNLLKLKGLNMFLVPINIPTFRFSPSKIFLQLLVPQKLSIFTFSPSFKVNSYVELIFLNKIL